MKRIVSLLLCLCLAAALTAPALAETEMEDELTRITQTVKQTLDIDDDYTSFSGSYNDGLRPGWYLYWSDDGRDLSVTCDENGVVLEAYFWRGSDRGNSFYGFDAAFPALTQEMAEKQAETWLSRLMGEGESARIDGHTVSLTEQGEHRFFGTILINGLDGPVSFSLALSGDGLRSYSRSDSYSGYVGEIPSPVPAVREQDAARSLAKSTAFELYYVAEDGEARLRYVPVGPYTVVDAQTGEAVDMDALYASFGGNAGHGPEAPAEAEASLAEADAGAGRALTEVELSSIANYRDAMDEAALDRIIRAVPGLGLEDFSLDRCSYSMDDEGRITARLRYTCEMDENHLFGFSREAYEDYVSWDGVPKVYKDFSVNAGTGDLISLYTGYPLWEEDREAVVVDYAEDPAEAFLEAVAPERFAETELCALTGKSQGAGETFARMHEGFFFPENYLYVALEPDSGTVEEYRSVWDEDMIFAPSAGIVDETTARYAYIDALDVTLGYAAWPEDIDWDDPVLYRYADWGYTFVESLRLGYYYLGTADVAGVDALTGEPIVDRADGSHVYTDLDGVPQREMIEALGEAGIGFSGGFFRPEETLTQRAAVELLLQAAGYQVDVWDDEALKDNAVWYGFLSAEEWDPDAAVTRMELTHMILGSSVYGAAAQLDGIWAVGFPDVRTEDAGYAAIAQALGRAEGAAFRPNALCTRATGAELLYRFMAR